MKSDRGNCKGFGEAIGFSLQEICRYRCSPHYWNTQYLSDMIAESRTLPQLRVQNAFYFLVRRTRTFGAR